MNPNNPMIYNTSTAHLPDDFKLKISPSKFSRFVEKPHQWFREVILGEEGFTYSTASVLGTVVHYIAECVAKKEEICKNSIVEYIYSFEENETYNRAEVDRNFESMSSVLVNQYVLPNMDNYLSAEQLLFCEISSKFYASGSLDFLQGEKEDCIIGDYKTYSSKTKPKVIPPYYKYQLLVYAYIAIKNGYNPTRIRLVYVNKNIDGGLSVKTGKPLKSYPPELTVLTETIGQEDIDFISSLLNLSVEKCIATEEYPRLTHLLWHDMRLKV
jgi:hypothetical protein